MDEITPASRRLVRRRRLDTLAASQGGVLSRRQLYDAGTTRWMIEAEVRGGRWRRVGRHLVYLRTGPLPDRARYWAALLSGGPRAYLDGASSLIAGGLKGFDQPQIRITVPRGARTWRTDGVDVRQTRRWSPDDLADDPIRRSRNSVAAIRAGLWARSNKQAALVLTMTVQQGLASAEELGHEMLRIKRDERRLFLQAVIMDLLGGVGSLGELDFAQACRERGLPEPSRQVVKRGAHGKYYLDVHWERWGVTVEIDGIHHTWAQNVLADALRHNDIALTRDVVLRLPLLALRLEPDAFFAQIRRALIDSGWPGDRRRTA